MGFLGILAFTIRTNDCDVGMTGKADGISLRLEASGVDGILSYIHLSRGTQQGELRRNGAYIEAVVIG